jgi:hypothetical protein
VEDIVKGFIIGIFLAGFVVYLWRRGANTPHRPLPHGDEGSGAYPKVASAAPVPAVPTYTGNIPPPYNFGHAALASYQTAPLLHYRQEFQQLAAELFRKTSLLLNKRVSIEYKGSYSFVLGATVAKIIIYQHRLGRENGYFPQLQDGVYVLLRTTGSGVNTIGVAPKHNERFTYFKANASALGDDAKRIVLHVERIMEGGWAKLGETQQVHAE